MGGLLFREQYYISILNSKTAENHMSQVRFWLEPGLLKKNVYKYNK